MTQSVDLRSDLAHLDAQSAAALISAAADIALVVDRRGVIRSVSQGADPAFGGADEWVGRPWVETVTAETRGKVHALLRDAAAGTVTGRRQVNHLLPDGDVPVAYTAIQVASTGDVVALGRDMRAVAVLQQRLVETQQALERDYWRLRHVETRYRLLFQLSAEAVLVIDAATQQIVDANAAASKLFGVPLDRLLGRALPGELVGSQARALDELLATTRAAGRSGELNLTLDGDRGEVRVSASCFRQDAATLVLVRFTPAGGAAAEPDAPALASGRLAALVSAMPDGFAITDLDGTIRSANPGFLDIVQLSSEEQARGRHLGDWIGRPGADFPVFVAMLKKNGVMRLISTAARGEHGALTEVEVSASWLPDVEQPAIALVMRDVGRRVAVGPQGARDLARAVEQLTGLLGRVSLADLVRDTTDLVERHFIAAALDLTNDNRTAAAELLGLSRQSLYNKLRRQGITQPDTNEDAAAG